MTIEQKLFTAITGYEPGSPYSSARADGYYEADGETAKKEFLCDYLEGFFNTLASLVNTDAVYAAIEQEKNGTDGWFKAYESLGE